MPLLIKPHTVTATVPDAEVNTADLVVGAVTHDGPGFSVACKVEPMSAESAFGMFGIEVTSPHRLMCDPSDGVRFPTNARVVWGDLTFRVRGQKVRNSLPATAHIVVLLAIEQEP